jgi:hypothetical protein
MMVESEKTKHRWISTKDDLPPRGLRVIGYDRYYNRVGEARLSYDGDSLEFIDSDDCYITHWQPFPEFPIKEAE